MKDIIKIIQQLRSTSSTNDKIAILKTNKDNELLKKVLKYTYDPDMKYGVTEDIITPYIISNQDDKQYEYIFPILDLLARENINDKLRKTVGWMLGSLQPDEKELVMCILTKDLRCNISIKTIQKVWKDIIPVWGCMLASKYFDNEKVVEGKEFTLTTKLDGHRCIIIKQGDEVKPYTRQHKEYLGLDDIISDVKNIDTTIDFVLDGELLVSNYRAIPPETRYKATSNIVRKDGTKKDVTLVAFDFMPLVDFNNGKCLTPYSTRRTQLEALVDGRNYIDVVDVKYIGKDTNVIIPYLDDVVKQGEEGLMLNINDAPYECKRTKGLLKLKKFQTADVRVIDTLEGDGKYINKLGALTIEFEHKKQLHQCNVGSGFSDIDRETFWQDRNSLIGSIIEIGYFEVTENAKGGVGLRFPTFKRLRLDKNEISMY